MWIAIDFDHTIIDTKHQPLPGAKNAISTLRERGHKIMVHSCNNKKWIEKWMLDNDIRYDDIWDGLGKPVCSAYIDDLAVPYRGDWDQTLKEALELVEPKT